MKIFLNNPTSKVGSNYHLKKTQNKQEHSEYSTRVPVECSNVNFGFAGNVSKTITSQITNEKSKILRAIKNILETDIPIFSEEERIFAIVAQAHRLLESRERRKEQIEKELYILQNSQGLNKEQIYSSAQILLREYKSLNKFKLVENLPEPKKLNESYDYALVNKFKSAIQENNFNLLQVFYEHYAGLKDIETVEELSKKYPTIKIPMDAKDVMARKIKDSMPRIFYEKLEEYIKANDRQKIIGLYIYYTEPIIKVLSSKLNIKEEQLYEYFSDRVVEDILDNLLYTIQKYGSLNSIPEVRKQALLSINDNDIDLLTIDFDKFVTTVIKEHYLNGKKLNEIEYIEKDRKIKLSSIKAPEYKFEKFSEKIKAIITSAEKIKMLQKSYQKFTSEELQDRLNFFAYEEIGNNDEIFNLILSFNSCKFTEEDRQYLIKFLQILDKVQENEISLDEGLKLIKENRIKPHGTNKINEIEKKRLEEELRLEQHQNQILASVRKDFDSALNELYTKRLVTVAETCSKYYPNEYNEESLEKAKFIISLIRESLKENNPALIRNKILRFEIYNNHVTNHSESENFKKSLEYARTFNEENLANKSGQYLLKRQIIQNYPESRSMVINPEILDIIMENFANNPDVATIYLCKYEDYHLLEEVEKASFLKISEIFDTKNNDNKAILKYIIENDYINSETIAYNSLNTADELFEIKITPSAKNAILDSKKFPACMEFFTEFEKAITATSRSGRYSGIKQTGTNNNALEHKIEVKIADYTDRLFSSKNNYIFDIYSEDGLH